MKTSPVQSLNKPQYNTAKKAVKTAAVSAAAAGTVLYMARTGKLNPIEGGNPIVENIKAGLKKPADKILKTAEPVIGQIKDKISNAKVSGRITSSKLYKNALSNIDSLKKSHAHPLKEIKGHITKAASTIADKVESKFNPEKFQI